MRSTQHFFSGQGAHGTAVFRNKSACARNKLIVPLPCCVCSPLQDDQEVKLAAIHGGNLAIGTQEQRADRDVLA